MCPRVAGVKRQLNRPAVKGELSRVILAGDAVPHFCAQGVVCMRDPADSRSESLGGSRRGALGFPCTRRARRRPFPAGLRLAPRARRVSAGPEVSLGAAWGRAGFATGS